MSKKNDTPASLRAAADAAVTKWRELNEIAKAKRAAQSVIPTKRTVDRTYSTNDLKSAQLDVEALQAEAEAERARHVAVIALDAAELAEGDETSRARNPRVFHDDRTTLDAEETLLQEKLASVGRRLEERTTAAFQADGEHAARRVQAGQPPSTALPRTPLIVGNVVQKMYRQVLAERVESGEPMRDFTDRIKSARAHVVTVAAKLEEKALEDKAREDNARILKENKAWEVEQQQKAIHANEKERNAALDAENRRREKLANDYLGRQAKPS